MRAITAVFLILASALSGTRTADAAPASKVRSDVTVQTTTDVSAQQRRRPRVRIYREYDNRGVYPSNFPGSNAVRDCSVTYVQEFRPSGTVIVPNMKCFWRRP